MVTTRQQAIEITQRTEVELKKLYGKRLKGVCLYGSAVRGELTEDSDIDIAIILDKVVDRFSEHERVSRLGSDISLAEDTLVSFLFAAESDIETGRFAVHRAIKEEGIPA